MLETTALKPGDCIRLSRSAGPDPEGGGVARGVVEHVAVDVQHALRPAGRARREVDVGRVSGPGAAPGASRPASVPAAPIGPHSRPRRARRRAPVRRRAGRARRELVQLPRRAGRVGRVERHVGPAGQRAERRHDARRALTEEQRDRLDRRPPARGDRRRRCRPRARRVRRSSAAARRPRPRGARVDPATRRKRSVSDARPSRGERVGRGALAPVLVPITTRRRRAASGRAGARGPPGCRCPRAGRRPPPPAPRDRRAPRSAPARRRRRAGPRPGPDRAGEEHRVRRPAAVGRAQDRGVARRVGGRPRRGSRRRGPRAGRRAARAHGARALGRRRRARPAATSPGPRRGPG